MNIHTDYYICPNLDGFIELNQEQIAELRTKKLYKLLNKKKCHRDFQYQTGLNVDTVPFNPNGMCQPGGLYFTDYFNILYNLGFIEDIYWIVEVSLPENVRVYEENVPLNENGPVYIKYKADKIIISEPQRFDLITFEFTPELVDCINNRHEDRYSLKNAILKYLSFNEYIEKVNTFLYLVNNVKLDFWNMYLNSLWLTHYIFDSCPIQHVETINNFRKHYIEMIESAIKSGIYPENYSKLLE
jgi:hypothetical protein